MASGRSEHPVNAALATPEGVTQDLLDKHVRTGDNFWRVAAVFGILLILGVIGFVMRLADGFGVTTRLCFPSS